MSGNFKLTQMWQPCVYRGSHVTITHDALNLTTGTPSLTPQIWALTVEGAPDPSHGPLLVTSGGHSLETCSN